MTTFRWIVTFLGITGGPFIYKLLFKKISWEEALERSYFMLWGAMLLVIIGPWR